MYELSKVLAIQDMSLVLEFSKTIDEKMCHNFKTKVLLEKN